MFTPAQLSSAVRQGDRSLRHGAYARGQATLQDLSDAGRAVLPSAMPDSGTPARAFTNMATLGGAGMGYVPPEALMTGAGLLGAYTPAGTRLLTGLLAHRKDARHAGAAGW